MTLTARASEIAVGNSISITFGVATAHCAIGVKGVYGTVSTATEKAVEVTTLDGSRKVWFPRRALVRGKTHPSHKGFDIAQWFTPSAYQRSVAQSSTLAA